MQRLALVLVMGLLLLACGAARADIEIVADLQGENVVPPVRTLGYGFAYFYIPEDLSFIYYYVAYADLEGEAVLAHIHVGPEGRNGPVIFDLRGVPGGTAGEYEGFLTRRNFVPGGLRTYEQAIRAMAGGRAYVDIHTTAHRGGEVRGQTQILR